MVYLGYTLFMIDSELFQIKIQLHIESICIRIIIKLPKIIFLGYFYDVPRSFLAVATVSTKIKYTLWSGLVIKTDVGQIKKGRCPQCF